MNFPDPFITCCFVGDEVLYINLFHTHKKMHYHFYYNIETGKLVKNVVSFKLGTSSKNFPYKCFYNDDKDEVYSFYRQGHALIV